MKVEEYVNKLINVMKEKIKYIKKYRKTRYEIQLINTTSSVISVTTLRLRYFGG